MVLALLIKDYTFAKIFSTLGENYMNEDIFNGIANIYDKYRPTYPHALFTYLCSDVGMNVSDVVADIGSGTGILSKKLLDICNLVYAIEPNNDMRRIAELNLSSRENFVSIHATAEATTLHEHCVNYITAAQSFHWFNRIAFKAECQRILKDKGQVILIWNRRDEKSDMVQAIDSISKHFCPNFSGSSCGMRGATAIGDYKDFFTGNYVTKSFSNPLIFNQENFLGLHQSASYCPNKDEENYSKYIDSLTNFFESHCRNGLLTLENSTHCYIGYV